MLLLTFSGVKGTVSIATILLIPSNLEQEYPLLLFLVAGVTLVSFLTGLLVLPHLSEEKEPSKDQLMHIAILNDVAMELEKDLENTKTRFHSMRLLTIIMDVLRILFLVKKTKKFKRTGKLLNS